MHCLPAWRSGLGAREIHAAKLHLVDAGLLAHLLAADAERIRRDDQVTGKLLENFTAMEIVKHAQWAATDVRVHHYRNDRDEIDLVLESRSRDLAAVEVKAGASLNAASWRVLSKLREATGDRVRAGIVVYSGRQTIPLADRLGRAHQRTVAAQPLTRRPRRRWVTTRRRRMQALAPLCTRLAA